MALTSIVIVNFNGRHYLLPCLQALFSGALPECEIIVVDNGSSDGSVDMIATQFPSVRLISLERNLGFAGANNVGIRSSRGQYLALLNNDTLVKGDWLAELVSALERSPEVSFCASKILLMGDPSLIDACGDFYAVEGIPGKTGHGEPGDYHNEPREVFGACGGAALYRRSMLEDVGLFDEDFFIIYEDSDLSFRAQLMGHRCMFIPSAIVYHHLGATVGSDSGTAAYYVHRNMEFVYLKNMPTPLLLQYWPLHTLTVWLFAIDCLLKGKSRQFVRAKRDVLRSLPIVWQKRAEIQRSRRVETEAIRQLMTRGWLVNTLRRRNWQRSGFSY